MSFAARTRTRWIPAPTRGQISAAFGARVDERVKQFVILLAVSLAYYGPALGRHFFWADDIALLIRAQRGLTTWADVYEGHFAPVFRLWTIAQWRLFGLHSAPFQLVSIVLLSACGFLMLRLLLRTGASQVAALIACVIFVTSPVNSENGVWFTMQSEFLMCLFFFAALLFSPRRPVIAAGALLLSFGSFAAAPLLVAPFCLYCLFGEREAMLKAFCAGIAAAGIFVVFRMGSGAHAVQLIHPIGQIRLWPAAIALGVRKLVALHSFKFWIPATAALALALLAKPVRISRKRALSLLPPACTAVIFILGAYWFRGNVATRHLMMPFAALLWLATALICAGRVSATRQWLAGALLAVFVCYPFWLHTQTEIRILWEAEGQRAWSYTQELKRLLAGRAAIYDARLIRGLDTSLTLSEYVPLADERPASGTPRVREYPWIAELPLSTTERFSGVPAWLALNYDEQTRDFYARYYAHDPPPPLPANLLRNAVHSGTPSRIMRRVSMSGDPALTRRDFAGNVAFQAGGCLSQTVEAPIAGSYGAIVFVRSFGQMALELSGDPQPERKAITSSGTGRYQLLYLRSDVPDGVHSLKIQLCSPVATKADIDGAAVFRGFPPLPASDSSAVYAGDSTGCAIDTVEGSGAPVEVHRRIAPGFEVTGWAVDLPTGKLPRRVFLTIDGQTDFPVVLGMPRPDVSAALHNDNYLDSGFTAYPPVSMLADGDHSLSLKVASHDGARYWKCIPSVARTVRVVE